MLRTRVRAPWLPGRGGGRVILRKLLAVALSAGVAGCAVGPDFVTPPVQVAPTWLEWRSRSLNTKDELYRNWWLVFHDPILNRLIEIAYAQNLTLLSAGTRVLEARANLGIAIGEFYPQKQQGFGGCRMRAPARPIRNRRRACGATGATPSASKLHGNSIFGVSFDVEFNRLTRLIWPRSQPTTMSW